ncbi:hypothetical protein B0H10DRAFT_2237105 [Mycena sp. CBHHK59/15]|nr:hypothetical protein B0H10DRAFT_2237105 [Mycena sp. CBHHK59/15]
MAQPSPFTRWAVPTTPGASKQPFSARTPTVQRSRTPKGIAHTLTEANFYGEIQFGSIRTPATSFDYSPPKKRCLATSRADENTAPFAFTSSPRAPLDTPEPPNKRAKPNPPPSKTDNASGKRKPARTDAQKIESILDAIQEQRWSLGCFLYNIFRIKDAKGNPIHRSPAHSQMVSIFLAGRGKKTVANIITEWMAHADGRIPETSPNWDLMYLTTIPYNEIRPVRAALTAFSTQTIGKKVRDEAESAVKLGSGLHVSIGSKHPETKLCREDFGDATIPRVKSVIEREQAVTLYLCNNIAMRKPRKRDGVILERKTRPADTVIIHAIASLNFCRTDQANLLPLMRGILYFGSSAPVELMNYNSRIGNMPAPTTIRHALCSLSEVEAIATAAHGADPETAVFLFVDNCQNYHRQRDLRVGRENIMNVGMSGLYMEAPDIDVNVFNLEDKRKLIAENRRKDVTVDDLLGFLDQGDADLTGTLHFLEALVLCIPSLKSLSKEISMRFSATATIHGKKETIPVELRDVTSRRRWSHFAMLLQLQIYLQFHNDAFKSFELLEPQLQVWHTKWTDVTRIFQTHWGRIAGKNTNPASLGFSAAKIGRPAPSDMKKIEFYPGTQLMYLVLDAKLLDIWRLAFKTEDIFTYFDALAKDSLPSLWNGTR